MTGQASPPTEGRKDMSEAALCSRAIKHQENLKNATEAPPQKNVFMYTDNTLPLVSGGLQIS